MTSRYIIFPRHRREESEQYKRRVERIARDERSCRVAFLKNSGDGLVIVTSWCRGSKIGKGSWNADQSNGEWKWRGIH